MAGHIRRWSCPEPYDFEEEYIRYDELYEADGTPRTGISDGSALLENTSAIAGDIFSTISSIAQIQNAIPKESPPTSTSSNSDMEDSTGKMSTESPGPALRAGQRQVSMHRKRSSGFEPKISPITEVHSSPVDDGFHSHSKSSKTTNNNNNQLGKAIVPTQHIAPEAAARYAMESIQGVVDVGARYSFTPRGGVLKITNIPYSITKEEVVCLMGREARLLPAEVGSAVHIIMERSTAKTMDCFVEFCTPEDALRTYDYVNGGIPANPPRLGSRPVFVEKSSQDELLHALFPRAKCVVWRDGCPYVMDNTDPYSTGYQGLFTKEEIYCVVRHAEFPRRAPFAEKCPQRAYESMVSTLYKFPWYAATLYTIDDRNALFDAIIGQLKALVPQVKRKRTLGLNERLLNDLLGAGLRCPVFNERHKFYLYKAAGHDPKKIMPFSSVCWPFDTLVRKPGATEAQVTQFAQFMAQASTLVEPGTENLTNVWNPREHSVTNGLFGKVWFQYPSDKKVNYQFAINHEGIIVNNLAMAWSQAHAQAQGNPQAMTRLPN